MSVLHEAARTPASETLAGECALQYLVPCECCGAGMPLVEEGVVCCEYCGQERLVGSIGATPLMIPFALTPEQGLVEMKRWLRQERHRATSLDPIEQFLVPYWRVRRRVLTWHDDDAADGIRERCFDASMQRFEHFEPAIGTCEALGEGLPCGEAPMVVLPLDHAFVPDAAQLFAVTAEPTPHGAATLEVPADDREEAPVSTDPSPEASPAPSVPSDADGRDGERLPSMFVPGPDDSVAPDGEAQPTEPSFRPLPARGEQSVEIDRSVALVYVPFFGLRFTFQDETRTVVACGCTGRTTGLMDGELTDAHTLADRNAMLTVSGSLATRPLECPECKGRLEPWGAIVRCQVCGVACRHEHGGLVTLTCEEAEGDGVRLPFWCFVDDDALSVPHEPSVHADLSDEAEVPPRRVWIPAFRPCPPVLARKLALLLTEQQPQLVAAETRTTSPDALPVHRRVWSARALAKLTSAEIDGRDAADARDGSLDHAAPTLVWIPFERGAGLLTEPVTGTRISSAVIEEEMPRRAATRSGGKPLPG